MKAIRLTSGLVALVILAAVATTAQAGTSSQRVEDIVSQQRQIRADVKAEKNGWDNIAVDQRQQLLSKQDQLMQLLDGKQSVDELEAPDRVVVFDTLKWINALAAKADDERQVCRRERTTGSNRITRVCRSVGAMRHQREQAKDAMRTGQTLRMAPKTAREL